MNVACALAERYLNQAAAWLGGIYSDSPSDIFFALGAATALVGLTHDLVARSPEAAAKFGEAAEDMQTQIQRALLDARSLDES